MARRPRVFAAGLLYHDKKVRRILDLWKEGTGRMRTFTAMGRTDSGRYLIVFFVRKKTQEALIVSARDMTDNERKRYEKNKSSISKARSYAAIGEYWDQHDLSEVWAKTKKVKFEVVAEPEATYYPVEKNLSEKIQSVAKKEGVSSDTLVNLWLEQKIKERNSSRRGRKLIAKNA